MKTTIKSLLIFTAFALFVSSVAIFFQYEGAEQDKINQAFDAANLSGKLVSVRATRGAKIIVLDNMPGEYRMSPHGYYDGYGAAVPGDSIIKPSFSDTLIVKKRTAIYKFTFYKSKD